MSAEGRPNPEFILSTRALCKGRQRDILQTSRESALGVLTSPDFTHLISHNSLHYGRDIVKLSMKCVKQLLYYNFP